MSIIRQSTERIILVGPILDSTGAAKTDEVVGSVKLTKNGTVGAATGSTLAHDHAGKYKLTITTANTDTVGVLEVSLNSGTNDMPVVRLNVVEEAIFDALFAASATGELLVDIAKVSGDSDAANNLELMFDGTGYAGGTIPLVTKLADGAHGGSSTVLTLQQLALYNATGSPITIESPTDHVVHIIYSGISAKNGIHFDIGGSAGKAIYTTNGVVLGAVVYTSFEPGATNFATWAIGGVSAYALLQPDVEGTYVARAPDETETLDTLAAALVTINNKTTNLPTDPADQSAVEAAITAATSGLATATNLAIVAGYLDTEIAAILADTDELQSKLLTMIVLDGAVYQFTANALELFAAGSTVNITGSITVIESE